MIMMVVVEVVPSDDEEEQIVFSKMGQGLQSVDDNGDNCDIMMLSMIEDIFP